MKTCCKGFVNEQTDKGKEPNTLLSLCEALESEFPVWLEYIGGSCVQAILSARKDETGHAGAFGGYVIATSCYGNQYKRMENYGSYWRCWKSEPTESERKAAVWEDE